MKIDLEKLNLTEVEETAILKEPCTGFAEAEAAMCAFEFMSQDREGHGFYEGIGQLRYCCYELAEAIHVGFLLSLDEHGTYRHGSFDWDFVPWFCSTCVYWYNEEANIYGKPNLIDDWANACRAHGGNSIQPRIEPPVVAEPTDEELLKAALLALNVLPNTRIGQENYQFTYDLAATLSGRLNNA